MYLAVTDIKYLAGTYIKYWADDTDIKNGHFAKIVY